MTSSRSQGLLIGAGLLLLIAVPMAIALGNLHHPTWFPMLDLAQTDMRVRAVGSLHPPLLGLPGRIGPPGQQGSHPGPLSFWMLWPVYALFGGRSWGLFVSTYAIHLLAIATALWIAFRRGGTALMLAVALVLVVLVRGYGLTTLSQPWNPYLPVMMWLVVLLAAWSVLCDDLPMLPVLVFAGSFCMQTHLPYLGLAGGLIAIVFTIVAVVSVGGDAARRRELLRWGLVALGIGVLVWIPPVIDQIIHSPGNLTLIWRDLVNPPQAAGGIHQGVRILLVHLNPWTILSKRVITTDSYAANLPGVVLALVWAGSVFVAWRARLREILMLDVTLAVATALALVSMSKIYGPVYYYLTLWAWGTCALMTLAVLWTGWELMTGRRGEVAPGPGAEVDEVGDATPSRASTAGGAVLVMATVVLVVLLCFDARNVEMPTPQLNAALAPVVAPTARALSEPIPGERSSGRYLITWSDPLSIGSQGWGLFDDLDRRGFKVGILSGFRGAAPSEQLIAPKDARAVVHLAVGPIEIAKWRAKKGTRQVAYADVRKPAQRTEYARLRSEVIADLKARKLFTLVPAVDQNLVFVAIDEVVPAADRHKLERMLAIGLPVAVFVGPESAGA